MRRRHSFTERWAGVYPDDGNDAEELLAEADRRMYLEKQQQPSRKNRRMYPRMKSRVTIELQSKRRGAPILGNLVDLSLGGCYVETSAILRRESLWFLFSRSTMESYTPRARCFALIPAPVSQFSLMTWTAPTGSAYRVFWSLCRRGRVL